MTKSTHNKLYFIKNINEIDDKLIESIFYLLPHSRQQKAKNCYYTADKKIKIVEYFIVQQELKLNNNQDFMYGKNGKPYLRNNRSFNISHSETALAVVFSDNNIGIDVQKKIDFDTKLLARIANKREYQRVINADDKQLELTKLWTQKESLIKLKGITIAANLKTLLRNEKCYDFKHFVDGDFVICVCSKKHTQGDCVTLAFENLSINQFDMLKNIK